MFKINSEKELLQLLKVISEEAVKKSKKGLRESKDSAQERYTSSLKASENTYGINLSEQEEEEPPETEVEEPKQTKAEEPEQSEDEDEESMDPSTFGVSFDSVIKDINTLRAGRSTKDKDIKEQLLGYYDRLNDGERKILHLFLSELSKILQGALMAPDAQDPSEPPFNAEITFGEADSDDKSKVTTGDKERRPEEEASNPAGEDSSAPIQVNERQDLREIRKRVKRLMKRY